MVIGEGVRKYEDPAEFVKGRLERRRGIGEETGSHWCH